MVLLVNKKKNFEGFGHIWAWQRSWSCLFVCLFVLRLNVPISNFSVMTGRSYRFLGITSTFGE